jgi:hypothetical protein
MSQADKKIQIGIKSTKGLGTGANPEIGQRAAEEDLDKIAEALSLAQAEFLPLKKDKKANYAKYVKDVHTPVVSFTKRVEMQNLMERLKHPVR